MINWIKNKIKDWDDNSFYVVTDFDRTLTAGDSKTSWSILSDSDFICDEYRKKRDEYDNYYRPIEIDETIDFFKKNKLMIEWWNKHISLFVKYKLKEEVIKNAIKDVGVMKFRDGAIQMLKSLHKRNIPVIIISAGIGNFIELFLKLHGCYYDNIFIMSNFIKFRDGIAVGVKDMIIHSLNKSEVALPEEIANKIKSRQNILLMGDNLADVEMINSKMRKKALKIGFLEENVEMNKPYFYNKYDIVCTDKTSFTDLSKTIPFLIRNEKIKVLTIIEPWATLIKDKKKFIETRSWKTNYRGTLYIHTSLTKIPKYVMNNKELMKLVDINNLQYGYIICKCKLIDCIYMTEEYIQKTKNTNYQEYICGEYKVGRYAWILEDIQVLDIPIKAKGHLGIWNYD